MSSSVTLTNAANLRAYVEEFSEDIMRKFFHGFASAPFLTPMGGVKGDMILTEQIVGELVRRYKKTFDPRQGVIDYKPNTLRVYAHKSDLEIFPQDFEASYLGKMRSTGFNSLDNPFERDIVDACIEKCATECDIALWSGEAAAVPADTDGASALYNGYLKIITDALTAGTITSVATGALTLADMVEQTESVYKGLPSTMRTREVLLYMSVDNWALYAESYRENYSKNYMQKNINGLEMIKLDAGNAWIVPVPGMLTSNRIIATVKSNMVYGYDSMSDMVYNFKDDVRVVKMWADWKLGPMIGITHNHMIRVNNQA